MYYRYHENISQDPEISSRQKQPKANQQQHIDHNRASTMTMIGTLVLLALTATSTLSKEQLARRRDFNAGFEWTAGATQGKFYRGPEWGQRADADKGTKSSKSNSKGHKTTTTNGLTSSKSAKSWKSSKPPTYYRPPNAGPPVGPPSKDCPEYDDAKTCTLGSGNANECPIHSSCKAACVPKYCKLPKHNPHKVHGYERPTDDDRYVALGTLCGYFHYVQGSPIGRHEIEVCCDAVEEDEVALTLKVDDGGGDYGSCVECGLCKYPQKVSDACCKIAAGVGELGGRAGDYIPHCGSDGRGEVCCKCSSGNDRQSYVCIEEGADCLESLCPGGSTDTTAEPPFMTMTTKQSPSATEEQPMTTSSGSSATTGIEQDTGVDEQQPIATIEPIVPTSDQTPATTSDTSSEITTGEGINFRPGPPPTADRK